MRLGLFTQKWATQNVAQFVRAQTSLAARFASTEAGVPFFTPDTGHKAWVIAPSRAAKPGELDAITALLTRWGLEPNFSKECFATPTTSGRSGTVKERAEGLMETWHAIAAAQKEEIAAGKKVTRHLVSPISGQGGSHLVVNFLQKNKIVLPKIDAVFLGFSCTTSMLLGNLDGMQRIHGPMIGDVATGLTPAPTIQVTEELLFRTPRVIPFAKLSSANKQAAAEGEVSGEITGGNLGVLVKGIGSYTPFFGNKIVLVEQVGEDHQMMRMFEESLERGMFNGANAVVIGQLSVLGLPQAKKLEDKAAQEVENKRIKAVQDNMKTNLNNGIVELFEEHLPGVPLVTGLEIGHGFKSGVIPFGTESVLTLGKSPTLSVETRTRQILAEQVLAEAVEENSSTFYFR